MRERKRLAISWSTALGAWLLALLVAALVSSLAIKELDDYSGPVFVRLGSKEGADVSRPKPKVEPVVVPPDAVPTPVAASPASAPKPAASPKPALQAKPPTPATQPPVGATSVVPPPAPVVLRGSENGNSYDMTFDSSSGIAGRSLYIPIVLFMPLPFEVPPSLYDAIPDLAGLPGTSARRRAIFESSYEKRQNGNWQLKRLRQPEYDARPELWTMLEDAGYNLKEAEYKSGKSLRPVEVLFKVSAAGPSGTPRLEDVLMESSSGYSDIDSAVLYGFRKAEFSNSGPTSISGRFTYRF
jgi:hypothetical protein